MVFPFQVPCFISYQADRVLPDYHFLVFSDTFGCSFTVVAVEADCRTLNCLVLDSQAFFNICYIVATQHLVHTNRTDCNFKFDFNLHIWGFLDIYHPYFDFATIASPIFHFGLAQVATTDFELVPTSFATSS